MPLCSLTVTFFPTSSCLQPEDCGGDRLAAIAGRLTVEILSDLGIGLGVAVIQLVPVILPERLGVDLDHCRDLGLGYAVAGQRFDLAAQDRIGGMCRPTHL